MPDYKIQKAKAFRSGFLDGIISLIRIDERDSLEERSRRRIESYDSSYLRDSGDLERIGRDMKEAFSNVTGKSQNK